MITPHSALEKKFLLGSLALLIFSLLLDQITKLAICRNFQLHESLDVIPRFFNLTYVQNTGAAWSLFADYPWVLLGLSVVVAILIVWKFRKFSEGIGERYLALGLIEGGIIGNSIDRLWHGAVIDFLHFHYENIYHYPVFNIADSAIFCGCAIFIVSNLFRKPCKLQSAPK